MYKINRRVKTLISTADYTEIVDGTFQDALITLRDYLSANSNLFSYVERDDIEGFFDLERKCDGTLVNCGLAVTRKINKFNLSYKVTGVILYLQRLVLFTRLLV